MVDDIIEETDMSIWKMYCLEMLKMNLFSKFVNVLNSMQEVVYI